MGFESVEQYEKSIDIYLTYIHGEEHFIESLKARMVMTGFNEEYKPVTDMVYGLHKNVYSLKAFDIESVRGFEADKLVAFLNDFDALCSKSTAYTKQEFSKELGRTLNRLIKEYNAELIHLKEIKGRVVIMPKINQISQLRFTVNPPDIVFIKERYIDTIKNNHLCVGSALEKSLPWAVVQYPDTVVNKSIRDICKKHKMFNSYTESDWDKIISFENVATTFFIDIMFNLVRIPQALADKPDKYIEVTLNLRQAISDYEKALDKVLGKLTSKATMQTNSQMEAFSQIVDTLI